MNWKQINIKNWKSGKYFTLIGWKSNISVLTNRTGVLSNKTFNSCFLIFTETYSKDFSRLFKSFSRSTQTSPFLSVSWIFVLHQLIADTILGKLRLLVWNVLLNAERFCNINFSNYKVPRNIYDFYGFILTSLCQSKGKHEYEYYQ